MNKKFFGFVLLKEGDNRLKKVIDIDIKNLLYIVIDNNKIKSISMKDVYLYIPKEIELKLNKEVFCG